MALWSEVLKEFIVMILLIPRNVSFKLGSKRKMIKCFERRNGLIIIVFYNKNILIDVQRMCHCVNKK